MPLLRRGRARPARNGPGAPNRLFLIVLVLGAVGALAAAGSRLEDAGGPGRPAAAPRTDRGEGRTLTIAWGARPRSLDPAFATDATSANLVWNLMDPLVRLGDDLEPVPSLARGWSVSADGRRVTFLLRTNGRWTDGRPLTARDFEYAWKRVLSPQLDSPHASRLYAIKGARAYNSCQVRCDRLRARVGVRARGDDELLVTLAVPQPWFVVQTAHPAFLPVPALAVERLGAAWASPRNIVTSGPFRLAALAGDTVTLVKNRIWRDARRVELARVEGRVVTDAAARLRAFDGGQVLVLDGSGLPATEMPALRERREYEVYEALATYLYAFNVGSVIDVHQRRAMALAVDRLALVENVVEGAERPALALTPPPAVRLGEARSPSPWLPPEGDLSAARAELERAAVVERNVTLLHPDTPGHREIALAARRAWEELGIETALRSTSAKGYLDFRGPLSRDSADLYALDRRYAYADSMAGLEAWRCRSSGNKTNFCNTGYDRLLARARREPDAAAREEIYGQAEAVLAGEDGRVPVLPLFWRAYHNLENLSVRRSFALNPLGQIDLSAVEFR
jgi:ABC-type oligopeptide transport system substrate-binding subunit